MHLHQKLTFLWNVTFGLWMWQRSVVGCYRKPLCVWVTFVWNGCQTKQSDNACSTQNALKGQEASDWSGWLMGSFQLTVLVFMSASFICNISQTLFKSLHNTSQHCSVVANKKQNSVLTFYAHYPEAQFVSLRLSCSNYLSSCVAS